MKFICNNCGFSADIPEQMSGCPMCGSSNVSSAGEASKFPTDTTEETEDENAKSQNFKAAAGPTQRVTMTEGMNVGDKSASPARQAAARSEKKTREIRRKSKAPLVAVLLVLVAAAAAVAYFFFFK